MKSTELGREVARRIKKDLEAAFPSTQFIVNTSAYAGGDTVRVKYNGGPSRDEVEKIAYRYQKGRWSELTDSYVEDNVREGMPQVRFIFILRNSQIGLL